MTLGKDALLAVGELRFIREGKPVLAMENDE